ncbi:MAG: YtxH domain-containing protein, partial [Streptococcus sp.]|nr:YtxH domain-containing protein [Streptococcus sp.]
QVESGEITLDSVLEKSKSLAQQATEASKETLNNLKEQLEEKVVVEDPENGQEIIIEIEED